jgi:sigma-54 specific flagellar transcriptional regulator A
VAATNGDLLGAMRKGRFRQDLYFRLAGVVIELPSLATRREDIPSIAEGTLRRVDPARSLLLSLPVRRALMSPSIAWSGNVRQLEYAVRRARERALAADPEARELALEHFSAAELDGAAPAPRATVPPLPQAQTQAETLSDRWQDMRTERERLEEIEMALLREALDDAGGVVAHAARALGIARTTLASRLDALGLRPGARTR